MQHKTSMNVFCGKLALLVLPQYDGGILVVFGCTTAVLWRGFVGIWQFVFANFVIIGGFVSHRRFGSYRFSNAWDCCCIALHNSYSGGTLAVRWRYFGVVSTAFGSLLLPNLFWFVWFRMPSPFWFISM